MADLRIDIASEFIGAKAFKQADTATSRLTKQVNTLAKSYLGLVGVQKLLRGAGAAARAFAEDDKAAKVLGQTLTNLGLGFGDNARIVNTYISNLERQTGVLDDELRPAMDRLLRATGDITKSQKLLSLALDISAGTGKTLTQVSQSLQKGFLGQTQALGRLGVGLSKAELASSSFEDIQTRLAILFEGQAAMAADTYIGKMNKLTVATNNAKEIIGEGLFDALAATGGGGPGGFDNFTKAVEGASKAVAYLVKLVGTNLGILSLFLTGRPGSATDLILGRTPKAPSTGITPQIAAELKKAAAEKASAKARVALTKTTKEQTKAIKEQTALQKAGTLFDLEQTQIIAALKGKISEDERKRLELQLALLTGNTSEASKLAGEIGKAQGLSAGLIAYLQNLPDAKNPFSGWAAYLDAIEAQVRRIATSGPGGGAAGGGAAGITGNVPSGMTPGTNIFTVPSTGLTAAQAVLPQFNVRLVLDGKEIASSVSNYQTNDSLSGTQVAINRRSGSFATP
jgi:hypothetical protein